MGGMGLLLVRRTEGGIFQERLGSGRKQLEISEAAWFLAGKARKMIFPFLSIQTEAWFIAVSLMADESAKKPLAAWFIW